MGRTYGKITIFHENHSFVHSNLLRARARSRYAKPRLQNIENKVWYLCSRFVCMCVCVSIWKFALNIILNIVHIVFFYCVWAIWRTLSQFMNTRPKFTASKLVCYSTAMEQKKDTMMIKNGSHIIIVHVVRTNTMSKKNWECIKFQAHVHIHIHSVFKHINRYPPSPPQKKNMFVFDIFWTIKFSSMNFFLLISDTCCFEWGKWVFYCLTVVLIQMRIPKTKRKKTSHCKNVSLINWQFFFYWKH